MPSRSPRRRARRPRRSSPAVSARNRRSEAQLRRELCTIGSWIYSRNLTPGTDGNISVRLDEDRILISPTAICKGFMRPADLAIAGLDGRFISGPRRPSSEIAMHLLIYRLRPDVGAICHAHPPTATGFAAVGLPLNRAIASEVVVTLGSVPLAAYGTPGTPELTQALEPLVPDYDAILMANHGVVTCGPDLETAYFRLETVEHFAHVQLVAKILGKESLLSAADVDKLLAARAAYGAIAKSKASPARPIMAEKG